VFSIKNTTQKDKVIIASGFFFIAFFVKLLKDLEDFNLEDLLAYTLLAAIGTGIFFILKYPFDSK